MEASKQDIIEQVKTYSEKDLKLAATLAWIERTKRHTMPDHIDDRPFESWFKQEILDKF